MPAFPADHIHLERAAQLLTSGELVAFPTETVYGLGANALDSSAVAKIYATKGRPGYNPLIVHVANLEDAHKLVAEWTENAQLLAQALWPGPLTLVLPKTEKIPDIVSAGLPTVAIRIPASPVALELLKRVGVPLAAPSANRSGEISPTRASHVLQSLGDDLFVLDGGECQVGIESTVVDVSGKEAAILRPGTLGADQIAAIIGPLVAPSHRDEEAPRPSPGMLERHYAPRAHLHLFPSLTDAYYHAVVLGKGRKIGVIAFAPTRLEGAIEIVMPLDPLLYAQRVYAMLRDFDAADVGLILVEEVPEGTAWDGVRDRLTRASKAA